MYDLNYHKNCSIVVVLTEYTFLNISLDEQCYSGLPNIIFFLTSTGFLSFQTSLHFP